MRFDVYCDESRQDIFTTKKERGDNYLLIGSLWLPYEKRDKIKAEIREVRIKYNYFSEIKWKKVSTSYLKLYYSLVDLFIEFNLDLRFRCIAVNASNVDFVKYHVNDEELGFYKFYYQMLHHWILDFNEYRIFCDLKTNRKRDRLKILHKCLLNSNLSSKIIQVQALPSKEVDILQMTDFFLGAVSTRLNGISIKNVAKIQIIKYIEKSLGRTCLKHTNLSEQKFNIFVINLRGGW